MKNSDNRSKRLGLGIAFVLALLFAISGFLALQNSSSRMAAAAVVESPKARTELTVNRPVADRGVAKTAHVNVAKTAHVREAAAKVVGTGEASYYGRQFAGRPTANGERFDPAAMTAAHRTLPFGTKLRVTNLANGRSVVVRVNDRGPYAHGRVIDVSRGAAQKLGMIQSGTADVKIEKMS